ncbi:MAG: NUDIX domain-containing protein [Chloroflexi bacterium]|nr:NUDIX domain-containing protein [Chloroflexota bacterium]
MSGGIFHAGIGALVQRRSDGKYLLLKRSAEKDMGGGEWECVTGRVEQGESFSLAVSREVREELGVAAQIEFLIGTMHLFRGKCVPENEMLGVQYCCTIADSRPIKPSAEHSEYRWVTLEQAEALLPQGHWLAIVIRRAETINQLASRVLLNFYRENTVEV